MQKKNTYRRTMRIVPILLLVVFVFASSEPVHSCAYKSTRTTYQDHLENVVVSVIPDWQAASFHVKAPLIGTTWNTFSEDLLWTSVQRSEAFDRGIHEFAYFIVHRTNAP